MKTITIAASLADADASLDVKLNPVELGSGDIVAWSVAFPRSGSPAPRHPTEAAACRARGETGPDPAR